MLEYRSAWQKMTSSRDHHYNTPKEFRDIKQKLIDLGLNLAGKEVNDYSNPPDAEFSDQLPVEEIKIEEDEQR